VAVHQLETFVTCNMRVAGGDPYDEEVFSGMERRYSMLIGAGDMMHERGKKCIYLLKLRLTSTLILGNEFELFLILSIS
jgi:hypothetical protein